MWSGRRACLPVEADSHGLNDFLLQASGTWEPRPQEGDTKLPELRIYCPWLLKWRGVAGGAEGGDSKSSRGEHHSQRAAAAVAVVAGPHPERHDGNAVMRQN